MRSLLVVALLACGLHAGAQTLQGTVRTPDGEAAGFAVLFWQGTAVGTTASEDGRFEILRAPGGDSLVCRFVGFPEWKQLILPDVTELTITLPDPGSGPVVVIESEQQATEINLLDAQRFQTLTEKELCKAACCSLSESFETNASVDASFTDAITGTRQIRMLGLEGRYTQVLFDNIPSVRGLASIYGLTYVPGPWVKEISIGKGAGSVVSGYESITGQINVAHKSHDTKEKLFLNGYAGSQGRFEFNSVWRMLSGEKWSSTLLVHGAQSRERFDMNDDGFLDNPLFRNFIGRSEWTYTGPRGLRGEYAASFTHISNVAGTFDYDPLDAIRSQLWGVDMLTNRADLSAKTGYVFPEQEWKSFGSQVSVSWHDQQGNYGQRSYSGEQLSARINLMYASEIGESSRFTTGLSYVHDDYAESLDSLSFDRTERVPGAFFEWTLNYRERLSVVAGLRGDVHNNYGFFASPRLHVRYSITDRTSIKASIGKGYRSPNLLMDNVGMFASNREILIRPAGADRPFGMNMEEAWNTGVVLARKFKLNYRDASITLDAYRTWFAHQIVVDWETPREVSFYQLTGRSYSNNFQAEMQWSPLKRMEWRLAYRWLEARTQYEDKMRDRPLVARHRFFTNLAYETKSRENGSKWVFDVTARWLGRQRLPSTFSSPHEYMVHPWSDPYWIFNAQVSYFVRRNLEFYVGGENLGSFMQMDPIVAANDPTNPYFDASMIWGPVFGRMGYVGFRWRIGE